MPQDSSVSNAVTAKPKVVEVCLDVLGATLLTIPWTVLENTTM